MYEVTIRNSRTGKRVTQEVKTLDSTCTIVETARSKGHYASAQYRHSGCPTAQPLGESHFRKDLRINEGWMSSRQLRRERNRQ